MSVSIHACLVSNRPANINSNVWSVCLTTKTMKTYEGMEVTSTNSSHLVGLVGKLCVSSIWDAAFAGILIPCREIQYILRNRPRPFSSTSFPIYYSLILRHFGSESRETSVGVATRIQAGWPRNGGSIPGRGKKSFSSSLRPDWLCGSPSLVYNKPMISWS
jgi:hypothetical protein